MATTVGEVLIELRAKIDTLATDMSQAKGIVDRGARDIQAAAQSIQKYMKAIGAGISIAGIGSFIQSAINAADEMSKLSQKSGIAVQDLAGLQLAFRQSGIEAGALQTSMSKMAVGMAKGNEAFAAMGLSAKNADGSLKSTRVMLGEVADKFQGYADGAEKTALAVKLFGRSGAELIPLLNGGSEALAEFDAMAQQLGLTMDESTARNAEKFNDTMDLVGQGVVGVGRQIAANLLPTLTGLAGEFLTTMTSGDKLKSTAEFLATALKGLYVAGLAVVEAFKTVGTTLGGVFAAIGAAISGDFAGAKAILSDLKTDIGNSWMQTLEQAKAAWDSTGNAAVEAMTATSAATKAATPNVEDMAAQAKSAESALKAAGKELDRYFAAEEKAAEARAETMSTLRAQVDALERQLDVVNQGEAAQQAVNRQLAIENAMRSEAAQKLLPHQREEYARLIGQQYDLEAAMKVAEDAQKSQADEAKKAAEAMQTAYFRAIERVRDGIGDFFVSMIRDGKASFDSLLDFFKQMLAEMIATAAANRILIGLGLVSGSAGAAAGGAAGGVSNAASTAGSLANIGGTVANVGGSILSGLGALGKLGGTMASVSSTVGMTLVGAGDAIAGAFGASGLSAGMAAGIGTMGIGAAVAAAYYAIKALAPEKQPKWGAIGVTTGDPSSYSKTVGTVVGASGLTLTGVANRTDAAAAKEMLQAFAGIDTTLTQLAAVMGVTVDLSGKTIGNKSLRVDGQGPADAFGAAGRLDKLNTATLKGAPDEFVRAWLDATAESFDENVQPYIARISGTAEEMLTQFAQIAEAQAVYAASTKALQEVLDADTLREGFKAFLDAGKSVYQVWQEQGDAIVKFAGELADSGDYAQLTAMVQQRYQTELALIGQVMGALQQINGIFAGTIEQIRLDTMQSDAQRYAYFEQQIEALAGSIGTMTDPQAITDTLKQIDALAGRSWGLLDESGKTANWQAIIDFLQGVEDAATARLEQILGNVSADGNPNAPGSVGNAIKGALDESNKYLTAELERIFADVTPKQQAAADKMEAAAGAFAGWAQALPTTINVTFASPEVNV